VIEPVVFVVDDDSAIRQSLQWLIESTGRKVVTFASAQQFLDSVPPVQPGCLVLDINMPGITGLELQEQLTAQNLRIPVIVISGHADVASAVRAMKAGAVEFLEKPFDDDILLQRIEQAIALDARRREEDAKHAKTEERLGRLTPREREIMELVVAGHPNKRIAAMLCRSEKTVEIHRANVMQKMEAGSLAELVREVEVHHHLKTSR